MVVAIFTTAMLSVAQFTATCNRKLSHFPFLRLPLVLGNLLENASRLDSRLTLLKEGNHLERVGRHCLVQVCELVPVRLGLRKEDLLTLLLCRGYFHCSAEVRSCTQFCVNLCIGMREGFLDV
jgi:hypothetical protein